MAAAVETPVEKTSVPRLLTNLVSVLGLGALAGNTPGAPVGTPIVMALLALGTRRESESVTTLSKTAAVGNAPVATLALTGAPTAALAAPSDPSTSYVVTPVAVSGNTWKITQLTGPGGLNNTQSRFGVGGTDLGIMWDNGISDNTATAVNEHQVLMLFGDTFSNSSPVRTGVWRNNFLFRSSDNMLSNGIYVQNGSVPIDGTTADDFSGAPLVYNSELNQNIFKQVIANERYAVGNDVTIIPTSAISVTDANGNARQYATFMDVRSWDSAGRWTTNYSGVAFSDDNGVTWHVAKESIRASAPGYSTVQYVSGQSELPAVRPSQTAGRVCGRPSRLGLRLRHSVGTKRDRLPLAGESERHPRREQVSVLERDLVDPGHSVGRQTHSAGNDQQWVLRLRQDHDVPQRRRDIGAIQRIREAIHHAHH